MVMSKLIKRFMVTIFIGVLGISNFEKSDLPGIDCEEFNREETIYGIWQITGVAVISEMYTGTLSDGDSEENMFDPEDYIGYELEYASQFFRLGEEIYMSPQYVISSPTVKEFNSGGKFQQPDLYEFIKTEDIKLTGIEDYEYISEIPLQQYELSFDKVVGYEKFDFIPVGTQCVLLNNNTMLVGVWGKILVAQRVK